MRQVTVNLPVLYHAVFCDCRLNPSEGLQADQHLIPDRQSVLSAPLFRHEVEAKASSRMPSLEYSAMAGSSPWSAWTKIT